MQTFGDWYEENKYDCVGRLHLDKDILYPGNDTYCPEKCMLVPQYINAMFVNKPNKRGLPNGIKLTSNNKYLSQFNGKYIGTYNTLEEAFLVHAIAKENRIKEIANLHKNESPKKVFDALMNYEVKIENDKNYVAK